MISAFFTSPKVGKAACFAGGLFCSLLAVSGNSAAWALASTSLIALAFYNGERDAPGLPPAPAAPLSPNRRVWIASLCFYAIVSAAAALLLSRAVPVSPFAGLPWALSIVLLFCAAIAHDWPAGLGWREFLSAKRRAIRWPQLLEIFLVIALTLLAFMLRGSFLERYPPMIHGDEGEMGMEALLALRNSQALPLFGTGWLGFPNLFFYIQALSLLIFGPNIVGLRMLSAIFGAACVPLVYLLARAHWGRVAALIAAWLLTVSHLSIHYSRLGLNNIESEFFLILFALLFLAAFKRQNGRPRLTLLVAAGVAAGLAQYMYLGARLIPLLAAGLLGSLLLQKRLQPLQVGVLAIAALAVYAPLGMLYLQSPADLFFGRMNSVSIFQPGNITNTYGPSATLAGVWFQLIADQFTKNLKFFIQSGDVSAFYLPDLPAFDIFAAALFWPGLGFVIARIRRLPEQLVAMWFAFGLISAGMLTGDSPNGPRLLMLTPSFFLACGIGAQWLWNRTQKAYARLAGVTIRLEVLAAPLLAALFLTTFWINYSEYFDTYYIRSGNVMGAYIAREIIAAAPDGPVYLMGHEDFYVENGAIRFVAGEGKAANLQNIEQLPPRPAGKPVTLLLTHSHFAELTDLQRLYPAGESQQILDPLGRLILVRYRIPPAALP